MAGWAKLETILYDEITERGEEGCITDGFKEKVKACENDHGKLMEVYRELMSLKVDKGCPYNEPNELDDILALSEGNTENSGFKGNDGELNDRLYGAWLGRSIGCIIGKPFEWYPFISGRDGKEGWEYIKDWLIGADSYPLDYYPPENSKIKREDLNIIFPASCKENVKFIESDDDLRYTVVGLLMSEKYGNKFTPKEVAQMWLETLPAGLTFTSELQTYINTLNCELEDGKEKLEYCRTYLNPYREWIGAQIRADHYGYANAGYPLEAAKTAFNDASYTHTKNGIYGAMFIAATIAAAFTEKDLEKCIDIGLSVVPKTSRLYNEVKTAVKTAKKVTSPEELYHELWKQLGHYYWGHTINNAAAVAAVTVFANGDFKKAVTMAVANGWDTDCNGATVGSIMGAYLGEKALPEDLKKPLNNTLYSLIPGFHPIAVSECAKRSAVVFHKLHG